MAYLKQVISQVAFSCVRRREKADLLKVGSEKCARGLSDPIRSRVGSRACELYLKNVINPYLFDNDNVRGES